MSEKEEEFQDFARGVRFDDKPDHSHREKLEQDLLAALASQAGPRALPLRIWRTIMSNRITRIAAAAVIAIALLGPLSYGTAHFVRKFVAGSVGTDTHKAKFALGKDIYVDLKITA